MTDEEAYSDRQTKEVLEQAGQGWTRLRPAVEKAILELPEREETVLHLSLFQRVPDSSIAEILRLSNGPDQVAEIRGEALARLRLCNWAEGLSRHEIEGIVRCAGEAWRINNAAPLSEAQQQSARREMTRVVGNRTTRTSAVGAIQKRRDRALRGSDRQRSSTRTPALVLAVVVALFGCLWLVEMSTRPDTYALASISEYEEVLHTTVRGGGTGNVANQSFEAGAGTLLEAPVRILGLFPRFDEDKAAQALYHFDRSFNSTDDPFLRARAAFFLAKAHLMREETAEAERWLERVREQDVAAYRDDAESLLRSLRSR